MIDARAGADGVPDWILELPNDVFLECVREAHEHGVIQRAYENDWPAWMLAFMLRRSR